MKDVRSYWVSCERATFMVNVDRVHGIIVHTAPYARFLIGKKLDDIRKRYEITELK